MFRTVTFLLLTTFKQLDNNFTKGWKEVLTTENFIVIENKTKLQPQICATNSSFLVFSTDVIFLSTSVKNNH